MNWRFIIGLVVGYLIYRLVKKTMLAWKQGQSASPQKPGGQDTEVLVQDPVCGTFIPRQDALKVHKDGKDYFFCSEGCLKRFRRSGPG
ncbi:MAG: YHS domain-containing protein [Thermodesulfobacteriota bacterium]